RLTPSNPFRNLTGHLGNLFLIVQLHFIKFFLILKSEIGRASCREGAGDSLRNKEFKTKPRSRLRWKPQKRKDCHSRYSVGKGKRADCSSSTKRGGPPPCQCFAILFATTWTSPCSQAIT